jgi:hypothetical protein
VVDLVGGYARRREAIATLLAGLPVDDTIPDGTTLKYYNPAGH